MHDKIKDAKRELYYLLLNKKPNLTDNEIDIAYYLAKDNDIQDILKVAIAKAEGKI